MLDLFRDPIWQFLGFLLAILSLGFTFWIYWHQRQIKELAFGNISSRRLLSISDEVSSRVKVELDGIPVNNLHLLVYALKNSGHKAILPSDFQKPFTISFNKGKIVSAEITAQLPLNLDAKIEITETEVELRPLLLNTGDQLLLQVLLSASEPDINVDARILDISKLMPINTNPKAPPIGDSMLPTVFGMLSLMAIVTYVIEVNDWWSYFASSVDSVPDVHKKPFPPYLFVLGMMFFGFMQVTIMRLYERLGPASRRYINEN